MIEMVFSFLCVWRQEEEVSYSEAPVFGLPEPTRREQHAMGLATSAQAKIRKRQVSSSHKSQNQTEERERVSQLVLICSLFLQQLAAQNKTPKFSGTLSPAGRALVKRSLRSPSPAPATLALSHVDRQLCKSYSRTPSPAPSLARKNLPRK